MQRDCRASPLITLLKPQTMRRGLVGDSLEKQKAFFVVFRRGEKSQPEKERRRETRKAPARTRA